MTVALDAGLKGLLALPFDTEVKQRAAAAFGAWLSDQAHAEDRPQLEALVAAGRFGDLLDAFWQVIPFGTGGRRGSVGIGPNRFNLHTLLGSVQGHAELLAEAYPGQELSVVVAFDVRVYEDRRGVYDPSLPLALRGITSRQFAARAAGVYAGNGISVLMLDPDGGDYMSTPELSLAIRRHGAQGGLNVSASHNHPDDNGGKFYNRNGGQDVPPDDEVLARRVETIEAVVELPFAEALRKGRVRFLGPEENQAYLDLNASLGTVPAARGGVIVYSPLNGTGSVTVGRLLRREGFDVRAVPEQEGFDGRFPTVKFLAPNPEVPSCYELAERVADEVGADMVMTTDPDADRIGIEVRRPDGSWRFVNGDETLQLVLEHVLRQRSSAGTLPSDGYLLTTLVTSRLVGRIARAYGVQVVEDLLVGFKYMAAVVADLERDGHWRELRCRPESFVMGVEESHGLLMTHAVRDKDAAGPALALAELNALCQAQGRTLHHELDRIHATYGPMTNRLFTTVMTGADGLQRIRAIQESLRKDPPQSIAGRAVERMDDLLDETSWRGPLLSGTDAAARNVLVFALEGGRRVIIRPSGTEPKNKTYVEVPGAVPAAPLSDAELTAARQQCDREAEELGRAFEILSLERVGIRLSPHATRVSPLLGLDKKQDFGSRFLPELAAFCQRGTPGLESFVDIALSSYGGQPRELVRGGMSSWLEEAGLSKASTEELQRIFALP